MRIVVLSVGRWKRGPERALFDHYAARCPWRLELVELAVKGKVAPGELPGAEAKLLRAALPAGLPTLALDERGEQLDSAGFAALLGAWRDQARGGVVCLIGGADGLDGSLRQTADRTLSFGRLTWPHLLVRALLAEQLYRASTILAGHPYHRA
ncbi:MAG: 23S rRNA (pseudouridine(1915)-N(3))-methyltransferase RlmH [Geminicoccaceae bacterium]|nr:MAG: 23S rRNA (pseudouridine(1915)-N(3))-methyltransferase RlmH [Geminicoccaceae bacterium]